MPDINCTWKFHYRLAHTPFAASSTVTVSQEEKDKVFLNIQENVNKRKLYQGGSLPKRSVKYIPSMKIRLKSKEY